MNLQMALTLLTSENESLFLSALDYLTQAPDTSAIAVLVEALKKEKLTPQMRQGTLALLTQLNQLTYSQRDPYGVFRL